MYEVTVGEASELMNYLNGVYDFSVNDDVTIKLIRGIDFSSVGEIIDFRVSCGGLNDSIIVNVI